MDQSWKWLQNKSEDEEKQQSQESDLTGSLASLLSSQAGGQPPTAVAPESKDMDPTIKEYLVKKQVESTKEPSTADKYLAAMQDDKDIEKARNNARWTNLGIGLLGAINKGYGSRDSSDFVALQNQTNQRVRDMESAKQKRADSVLMADRLARQDEERRRSDIKWQRSEDEARMATDPTSPESQLAQKIASKMIPSQDFSKFTAAQIYKALPFVERQTYSEIQQRKLAQADDRLGLGRDSLDLRKEKEGRLTEQFGVSQKNKEADEAEDAIKMARNTETWKSAEKTLSNMPTLRSLLNDAYASGGQSLAMLGPKVAKAIADEVGVLTDKDVTRYVQNPALVPGMLDTLARLRSGQISEDSYENLNRLLDIAEKTAKDKMEIALKNDATLLSRRRGMSEDEARRLIDPNFSPSKSPSPVPAQAEAAPDKAAQRAAKIQEYKKDYPDYSEQEIEEFLKSEGIID